MTNISKQTSENGILAIKTERPGVDVECQRCSKTFNSRANTIGQAIYDMCEPCRVDEAEERRAGERQRILRCKCGKTVEVTQKWIEYFKTWNPKTIVCPDCIAKMERERAEAEAKEEARKKQAAQERLVDWKIECMEYGPDGRFSLSYHDDDDTIPAMQDVLSGLKWVKGARLDNFNAKLQPKAYEQAKRFLEGKAKGLLLTGPVGTGKTHLAAAIWNQMFTSWKPSGEPYGASGDTFKRLSRIYSPDFRFITENALFSGVKACFKPDADMDETEYLEQFTRFDTLILDDLCKYQPSDTKFRNRIYFAIFDHFWTQEKRVVITTNLAVPELVQELGTPTADRIRGLCTLTEFKGVSQR